MKQAQSELPKLSQPAIRALTGEGITRLKDLTKMSEAELKALHGIGPNALKQLREALKQSGLWYKAESKATKK